MLKKVLITVILAVILSVVFAVPALADEPANPGSFGQWLAEEAQDEEVPGLSYEVFFNAKPEAVRQEKPMGHIITQLLYLNGIPIPPQLQP